MSQSSATSAGSDSEQTRQLTDAERHRSLVRLCQVTVKKYRKSACSKKHRDIRKRLVKHIGVTEEKYLLFSILLKNCMKSLPESLTKVYRGLLEVCCQNGVNSVMANCFKQGCITSP